MQRIDKSKILSTTYKKWLDKLNKEPHPDTRTYYKDVVMNLLFCQKGVCAYTETPLCDPGFLKEEHWQKGRYKNKEAEKFGELEHFDPTLKKERYWDWENLFVVHADINRRKGTQAVDHILKPDTPGYDPFKLLEYDPERHVFIPHTDIEDKTIRRRIKHMIKVLQINHGTIRHERQSFLKHVSEFKALDIRIPIDRFFTAYQMSIR